MRIVELSFKLNKIVLIPNNPEKIHIKETPDEIGVWKIAHPKIPESKNSNNDHAKSLFEFVRA